MTDKSVVRRCLGCTATYPAAEHACPKCGSHAADLEVEAKAEVKDTGRQPAAQPKAKPTRRRKT